MGLDPLQFREQSVYLGFPFGKAITHTKIFKPVFGKFKKRIMAYSKIRKDLSIQQKVVIANVFLLPLFYYIGSLFIIPKNLVKDINKALSNFITPGRKFTCINLFRTPTSFGFQTPLHHIRWRNITYPVRPNFPIKPALAR